MVRLMVWNIDQFDQTKIDTGTLDGRRSLAHITNHLTGLDPRPDIFVVLEVIAKHQDNQLGYLTTGTEGAATLRTLISAATREEWYLVPPLQISRATNTGESVAVFYTSARTQLFFTGPYCWPGGVGPSSPGIDHPVAYDETWATALPAAPVPEDENILYNRGRPQNECAARSQDYKTTDGNEVEFGQRAKSPYMTTFAIPDGNGSYQNLSLFAIHGPSKDSEARVYLGRLANISEVADPVSDRELRVIAGDFNLNLYCSDGDAGQDPAYKLVEEAGYKLMLQPVAEYPPVLTNGSPDRRKNFFGFYTTQIAQATKAKFFPPGTEVYLYPGYRYLGSKPILDNIYTRYGASYPSPADNNLTILNSVVGTIFNQSQPPPKNCFCAPLGTLAFKSLMDQPQLLQVPNTEQFFNPAPKKASTDIVIKALQGDANYGGIVETSDHFALVIDL